nr:immunoglobulin heavy chain junction region [Macaca mulatta]
CARTDYGNFDYW